MRLLVEQRSDLILDFGGRDPEHDLRSEMSAVAADGDRVWTGSDEGRGVECFRRRKDGLVLEKRYRLDRLFRKMPKGEADLEALDVIGGQLWLTGSHCLVRPKGKDGTPSGKPCQEQPSRHLLGRVTLDRKGRPKRKTAEALPFKGKRSLRGALKRDPLLADFLAIPTKENGLDVEGVTVVGKHVLLGLRGPVIATRALLLQLPLKTALSRPAKGMKKHFLDLGGLGVRDLSHRHGEILILAGPVTSTGGPYRLFRWRPKRAGKAPELVHEWKLKDENPEGICFLQRKGRPGLLMLYDNPNERVHGSCYHADWFPLDG